MDANEIRESLEIEKAYREKYGIYFNSNYGGDTIIEKRLVKKTLYMDTGLPSDTFDAMMKTSMEIGTNYLEDCMLAAGKKWEAIHPNKKLPRGAIQ